MRKNLEHTETHDLRIMIQNLQQSEVRHKSLSIIRHNLEQDEICYLEHNETQFRV